MRMESQMKDITQMTVKTFQGELDGSEMNIGIVVSRFNEYAGKEELEACLDELKTLGVPEDNIRVVSVPGALEIPLALQMLAESEQFEALIALGAVIRGETYHFEVVANTSSSEIARVSREYDIPVANGILTTYDDEQCKARTLMKGKDCARCAVEMVNLQTNLYESFYDSDWEDVEADDDETIVDDKHHDGKC